MSQISAAAEAAIRSSIGTVSGIPIETLRSRLDTNKNVGAGQRLVEVDIALTGWSCSMHRQKMRWRETVQLQDGASGAEQADAVKGMFALRIAKQMKRLQEGVAVGLAVPLHRWMPMDEIHVQHILVDRAWALLATEGDGAKLVQMVQQSICNLHNQPDDGLRDEINGDQNIRGRAWTKPHNISADAMYYGDELWVNARLPETIMTAITGRTLGEVVEGLPAALTDHLIRKAQCDDSGGGTEFKLDADNATIASILAEWAE